jgi:hypothetical protein
MVYVFGLGLARLFSPVPWARWRLGQLLAQIVRGHGPGRGKKGGHDVPSFKAWVKDKLGWERKAADRAQQIGALPEEELEKASLSESEFSAEILVFSGGLW